MKKALLILGLMVGMMSTVAQTATAQARGLSSGLNASVVVKDTMRLAVDSIQPEPDPNHNTYVFTFWGTESQRQQRRRVQIEYESTSMYGTFTNDDFYNWDGSHGSGSYNYIRNMAGDQFYAFKNELTATVTDSAGATVIHVNGLINVFGSWTRVLLDATIPAAAPDDTVAIDLGVATVIPMNQLGYEYLRIDAANEDYSLAFGIVGTNTLQVGTYYQSDMLRPDLVLLPEDTIPMSQATLVVTDNGDGYHNLNLTLLSKENTLYLISMHTGLVEVTDTVQVVCYSGLMQNLSDMYGIYQIAGEAADYQVAIGLTPGVIETSQRSFTNDSVSLAYTRILDVASGQMIYIQSASGHFAPDSSAFLPRIVAYADLLGINGTLYQVAIPVGGSQLPSAVDTTYIDCGNEVGRLDYTYGAGFMGLVLGNETADVHVLVYNGLQMKGSFGTDMFLYNEDVEASGRAVAYVTTYTDSTFRFDNISGAEMRMDSIGDTVHIELNVVTEQHHMYCLTANLLPTRALTGDSATYLINTPLIDDGMMVAKLLDKTGNEQTFQLQFQRGDAWDEEGYIVGDGEVWSFVFMQDSVDGISGNYGYGAETLYEDDNIYHTIKEHGTEIRLMPMAGTLAINATRAITIPASELGEEYHTHMYDVEARIVMENGMLYILRGSNFLLCVDYDTEELVEFTESAWTAIEEVLDKQGMRVKKVLRNGMILLETKNGTYDVSGRAVKNLELTN